MTLSHPSSVEIANIRNKRVDSAETDRLFAGWFYCIKEKRTQDQIRIRRCINVNGFINTHMANISTPLTTCDSLTNSELRSLFYTLNLESIIKSMWGYKLGLTFGDDIDLTLGRNLHIAGRR